MPYQVEADVESYGWLMSDNDELLADVTEHDWLKPFPVVAESMSATWEPGDSAAKPNIFYHSLFRDFAVDDKAFRVLEAAVSGQLWSYAALRCDGSELRAVQAVDVLDVVDIGASIPSEFAWSDFSFPHIPESSEPFTRDKLFRVPNRGASLSIFIGNSVKRACEAAGLTGWLYHETTVREDDWE